MKKSTILLWLTLIVGLQVAWIAGTSLTQERTLRSGALILLNTRPVDPRDLLRGDYVILSYDISQIPRDKFSPPLSGELPNGTQVFVTLEQRGDFHEVVQASLERPAALGGGRVVLRGVAISNWRATPQSVLLEYGLERYYVREGTGNPRGKLTVQVAVPASGQAVIKQVFVDGVPYAEAMRSQVP